MANTEAVAKRMPQGDRRPIGVFDSGVGGLSVLRALEEKLPLENYIYFGDTARAPYGGRKPEEIRRFNLEIGGWLLERGCKMLVVACNTSTVWGMAALKEMASVPVYGLMDAVLEGTLEGNLVSRTDTLQMGTMAGTLAAGEGADGVQASDGEIWPVGFVATEGTVASGSYQEAFEAKAPGKPFYALACPRFVPLVEQGVLFGPEMDQAVSGTLLPLRDKGIRTLVLGCTHYPFMASAIFAYMGSSVRLVDPAYQMASIVADALRRDALLHDGGGEISGARGYWCSGDTEAFKAVAEHLLGCPLGNVGKQAFR